VGGVFRVVLPQLRLAICGGALLVGLHLLAEYGLYAMIRFDTFTTAIFDQFKSTFNGPAANMLAGVLALCCLAMLTAESAARGQARYARVGSGSARDQRSVQLGAARQPWRCCCKPDLPVGTGCAVAHAGPLAGGRWCAGLARRRAVAGLAANPVVWRGRRIVDQCRGDSHCLAVDPLTGQAATLAGRLQLHHQFTARHCRCAGAGHRDHSFRPADLPDHHHGAAWPTC
jgi:hypothetical protein